MNRLHPWTLLLLLGREMGRFVGFWGGKTIASQYFLWGTQRKMSYVKPCSLKLCRYEPLCLLSLWGHDSSSVGILYPTGAFDEMIPDDTPIFVEGIETINKPLIS